MFGGGERLGEEGERRARLREGGEMEEKSRREKREAREVK